MLEQRDLEQRMAYVGLETSDLERLARLRPALEARADELVEAFYRHLLSFPRTRRLLREPEVADRLHAIQRTYLLSLTDPELDLAYLADRRRIGETHEHIGLEPRWSLGAYAQYLSLLTPLVLEAFADDPTEAGRTLVALQRRLLFDAEVATQTYVDRREEEFALLNEQLAQVSSRLQADYAEQNRELAQTTRRVRAAEELADIGVLVAGLAHEIGTPMGVIQGHARLLEKSVSGERALWRLKTIEEQISRISRIIQALLNMARPKSSKPTPVPLESLLETTLSFLTEKFRRRQVSVARHFSRVPSILGDPERLQQLFLNLFLNAVDAMPEGGELRVELGRLDDGGISLVVADSGLGIPAQDLSRIFEPFFTSKDAGKGSGLGLTVVQGIVADHHGRIEVNSTLGEGTEFRIQLPNPTARANPDLESEPDPEAEAVSA